MTSFFTSCPSAPQNVILAAAVCHDPSLDLQQTTRIAQLQMKHHDSCVPQPSNTYAEYTSGSVYSYRSSSPDHISASTSAPRLRLSAPPMDSTRSSAYPQWSKSSGGENTPTISDTSVYLGICILPCKDHYGSLSRRMSQRLPIPLILGESCTYSSLSPSPRR